MQKARVTDHAVKKLRFAKSQQRRFSILSLWYKLLTKFYLLQSKGQSGSQITRLKSCGLQNHSSRAYLFANTEEQELGLQILTLKAYDRQVFTVV